MSRRTLLMLTLTVAVLVTSTTSFFYFRDNLSTHFPLKVIQAQVLRSGELPMWTRATGGGQPLGGNPNTLLFYPDTLLYLFLPAIVAFNLHFLIHFVIAFFSMRTLLRNCETDRFVSNAGGALYVVSGAVVSTAAFYNLVVAVALIPLAASSIISLMRGRNLGPILTLGVSCGLLGLAAEPLILASTTLLLLILSAGTWTVRFWTRVSGAVLVAVVVASPTLIAYLEISGEVERSGFVYSPATVLNASLSPLRVAELFVGPFQGTITDLTDSGFGPSRGEPFPQFLPSVFLTVLMIPAIALGWRGRSARWLLALSVFIFFALGQFNPITEWIVEEVSQLRVARFPEKLVIPMSVAAIVLVCRLVSQRPKLDGRETALSIVALAVLFVAAPGSEELAGSDRVRLIGALAVAGGVLLIAWRNLRQAMLASIAIAGVVAIFTLPIDWRRPYESPTLLRSVLPADAVIVHRADDAARLLPEPTARAHFRTALLMGDPIIGAKEGLRYVLDGSPDGMHSFLSRLVSERSTQVSRNEALKYAALAGAEFLITSAALPPELAAPAGEISYGPNRLLISRLRHRLPPLHAPQRIIAAPSVQAAAATIEREDFMPGRDAVASRATPAAAVAVSSYRETPNGFVATLEASDSATIVTRDSWFRAWNISIDGHELATLPANIDRLAFVVPRGRHTVRATFGRRHHFIGGAWLLSLLCVAGVVARSFIRSSRSIAAPAR